MAVIFFFNIGQKCDENHFVTRITSRGDFLFKYRKSRVGSETDRWLLRLYNLQCINDVQVDLLDNEFKEFSEYTNYLRLTTDIIDDSRYDSIICANYIEKQQMRKLCKKREEKINLINLIAFYKAS